MSSSDGSVKIDIILDNSKTKKGLEEVEKAAENTGEKITKNMNKAEKSMQNISKSFDGSKIAKQLKTVDVAIEKTSQNIDKQKEKIAKLQQAYEKTGTQKQKDNISQQIENTTASITKLETKLGNLKDKQIDLKVKMDGINDLDGEFKSASVSAVNSLDKIEEKAKKVDKEVKKISIGESITKTGKSISDTGDTLITKVTAPITALGVVTGKVGMDFEAQMSRVKAISGATGEEFEQLKKQAIDLGASTSFSAKESAEGFENLASAGFSVNEIMSAMPGLLDLAASSGESIATSSEIAGSALRSFELEANQAGHIADVLATNAAKTNAQVADTGEALKYAGTAAHTAGWSFEETVAAIGELSNYSIKGTQAGTTLREIMVRLASPSKEAAEAMQQIAFKAYDSQGKMKSLTEIVTSYTKALQGKTDQQKQDLTATIFGQEAMSGLLALVQGGSSALDDLTNSYKTADGAAKDMAKTMQDNSKSSIEQMMGSLETAAIKLEEVAAPSITNIANKVQELANEFGELSPETQQQVIEFALLAAAAGPVLKVLGNTTSMIGKLVTFGGRLGATFGIIGEGAELGGTALTAFSTAGLAVTGVVSALAIGAAGFITYNELLKKSVITSTDDLNGWEKAVNICTGGVIKSKTELQKAGLIYKDFGEGVSDSFKEGIEKATGEYHKLETLINQGNIGNKITKANQGKITDAINKIIDEAKETVKSRKDEIQKAYTESMTADDGNISENEQKILDIVAKGSDEKLSKINEIQGKITEIWNNAIANHGKLSEQDIKIIQDYVKEIQKIKAEASAKNEAESTFTENSFMERLNGLSAEDATKEYTDASKTIHDNYSKLKATYKTEIDDLNIQLKKARESGSKEDIAAIEQEIKDKNNAYDKAIEEEQGKRRKLLDMLYEKNPNLKGNINEVTGELFKPEDRKPQGYLGKLKEEFSQIREVTQSGMIEINKPIKDANGEWQNQWHSIYVTVDQATGNITGAYDTLTGEVGGYSKKFADDVKTAGENVQEEMRKLSVALFDNTNIKLDGNNILNADTGELITKLDNVIKKADGTKVAIQNINGSKVKLEFDKNGALTNYKDVLAAINGQTKDNPAIVKTKIEVDGKDVSTIDDTIKKLKDLPQDKNVKVSINGEKAIMTVEEAEKKLSEIPPDTNTDIEINTSDADTKIPEIKGQIDNLDGKEVKTKITIDGKEETNIDSVYEKLKELPPDTTTDIIINGQQITTAGEAKAKLEEIPKETNANIKADNSDANSKAVETLSKFEEIKKSDPNSTIVVNGEQISTIDEAKKKLSELNGKSATIYIRTQQDTFDENRTHLNGDGSFATNYTGSNNPKTGLSYVNEHGYESAKGNNIKMLSPGLAYISSHASGGDGINDHMTTVNEMHRDIEDSVNGRFGALVSKMLNSMGYQTNILNEVADNTNETAKNGQQSIELNEKLATKLVDKIYDPDYSDSAFSELQSEIDAANTAKTKADNMKIEDNSNYSRVKSNLDDINAQLDELKDKQQEISDSQSTDAGKGEKEWNDSLKKQLEIQQHELEKKKDIAEKEENLAKEVAQNEIEQAKNAADQQVKIAEEKKEKLTKLAEAVTTAIKNQLTEEKNAYDEVAQKELATMETNYNNQVAALEKSTKKKTDAIDEQIKALEEETTDTSREDTRTDYENKMLVLQNKMNNSASYADKQSYALQIKDLQKELSKQESEWSTDDQKQALEDEKSALEERENTRKEALEKEYNTKKVAKEKEIKATDEFYDKLLEEDSVNAQARYTLLNSSQQELVTLLNSYNPKWQNAGQSLADSLLAGLNSKKQSMEDAVNEILSLKKESSSLGSSDNTYYDADSGQYKSLSGYATGTNYNRLEGLYKVNEQNWETSSNGDVAYVSKGAAIKNHMQSVADMRAEVMKQLSGQLPSILSSLQSSIQASQADMQRIVENTVNNTTNNTKHIEYDGSNHFHIENLHLNTGQDVEQLFNEAESIRIRNKPY